MRVRSRKLLFGLIAIILVLFISLAVFLSLAFSHRVNTMESGALAKGPVSSADQAIKIAMPSIEQYATENNRTIKTVNATFYNSSTGASWQVDAKFEPVSGNTTQDYIDGYSVLIWADKGEIHSTGPQGHY